VGTFEQQFADLERAAGESMRSATALVSTAKQLQKAAIDGDLGRLKKLLEKLTTTADALRQEVSNTKEAWPLSPEEEERYLREEYRLELLTTAQSLSLQMYEQDQQLVAFPAIVRILPGERAVRVDKRKVATIRPSKLVSMLKANQSKKPTFSPERFLESLFRAYRLLAGEDGMGKVVKLVDIYEVLTLQPGAGTEYDQTDFGRDLLLLDRSGLRSTKAGAEFSLPAATGTKGGNAIRMADPDGGSVTYFGIRFGKVGHDSPI